MAVQLVTLVDVLANDESSAWLEVTPLTTFEDGDGRTWTAGRKVRGVYDGSNELKAEDGTSDFQVPATDSAGNSVSGDVLRYRIRRILGSGTTLWDSVALPASVPTVDLDSLTVLDATGTAVPVVVRTVNGVSPDASGNVDLGGVATADDVTEEEFTDRIGDPLVDLTVLFENSLA